MWFCDGEAHLVSLELRLYEQSQQLEEYVENRLVILLLLQMHAVRDVGQGGRQRRPLSHTVALVVTDDYAPCVNDVTLHD